MQGFTITGLAALAWVLEQLGANNETVARNEALTIRIDGLPGRASLLRELVKVNTYLCDANLDVERANKLCGQVNQALVMHGRTIDENRFKEAFHEFNENYNNDNIPELSKMQDFHAQLYVWGQEARRQSQESLETVKKDIDHAHFQERIPQIKDYETNFMWNDEEQRCIAKDDADSTFILRLLQNPRSTDFKSIKT